MDSNTKHCTRVHSLEIDTADCTADLIAVRLFELLPEAGMFQVVYSLPTKAARRRLVTGRVARACPQNTERGGKLVEQAAKKLKVCPAQVPQVRIAAQSPLG